MKDDERERWDSCRGKKVGRRCKGALESKRQARRARRDRVFSMGSPHATAVCIVPSPLLAPHHTTLPTTSLVHMHTCLPATRHPPPSHYTLGSSKFIRKVDNLHHTDRRSPRGIAPVATQQSHSVPVTFSSTRSNLFAQLPHYTIQTHDAAA